MTHLSEVLGAAKHRLILNADDGLWLTARFHVHPRLEPVHMNARCHSGAAGGRLHGTLPSTQPLGPPSGIYRYHAPTISGGGGGLRAPIMSTCPGMLPRMRMRKQ